MENKLWAILDIKHDTSQSTGNRYYKMRLIGIQDQEIYHTYIDPTYKNYKFWMKYIATQKQGYILSGLKTKKDNPYQINADYAPKIEVRYETKDEMANELEEYWQEKSLT